MDLLRELISLNVSPAIAIEIAEAKHVNPFEFGLRDKHNIAKAVENLLSSGIDVEFDSPANYKSMGIFYFTFKKNSDIEKAIKRITTGANKIDTSVEDEWTVAESQINEASYAYKDSGEFTDDLTTVFGKIDEIKKIIDKRRWTDWMSITDQNFGSKCADKNKTMMEQFKRFEAAYHKLDEALDKAA